MCPHCNATAVDVNHMMTSSNGNIFRLTDPLWGGFNGDRWIPLTKGQWRGALLFSLICAWTNGWENHRVAGDLRRYRAHYDVTQLKAYIDHSNNGAYSGQRSHLINVIPSSICWSKIHFTIFVMLCINNFFKCIIYNGCQIECNITGALPFLYHRRWTQRIWRICPSQKRLPHILTDVSFFAFHEYKHVP